jgi:hypothetical protein
MTQFRRSKDLQKEDLKRRMSKKPMGKTDTKSIVNRRRAPFKAKTDNPMGKDRVRDLKIKKISQMMERRESLRKNTKPKPKLSLPPKARGTGGVKPGGFRKPKFNPRRVQ